MRVGINGFGRIGKAITRINMKQKAFDIAMINDINLDNQNLAYQLKYDSTYGTLENNIRANDHYLKIDGQSIPIYHKENINDVPWLLGHCDIVIDASGVHSNVLKARKMNGKRIKHCIVTHSPQTDLVDKHIVMGVNEKCLDEKDYLISSSICDANAVTPVLKALDKSYGICHGFVTTLHPYLNYQNLLDGQAVSFGYPGTTYGRYELGRSSVDSLIPKPTSCIDAVCKVLPQMKDKFESMSFRVPTKIVSVADISVKLEKNVDVSDIHKKFKRRMKYQNWKVFAFNDEPLVSMDFAGNDFSAVIDRRWTKVNEDYVKLVLWYDNEWGYSSRVVDLVKYLEEK